MASGQDMFMSHLPSDYATDGGGKGGHHAKCDVEVRSKYHVGVRSLQNASAETPECIGRGGNQQKVVQQKMR